MVERKKTLVILTPGFAANEAESTCLPFLQSHIVALNRCYPSLTIIILAFQYPYFKGNYDWHGNRVVSFDGREKGKWSRLQVWIQVWKALKQIKRENDIAGLFSLWCTECALVGHYFGKRYQLKHYNWLCGQDAKAGNKYVKLIGPAPGELIAMSDFLKREFNNNYSIEPAHVIPIGVDPLQFPDEKMQRDVDILGVGSLIPLKQYDVFVKVVKQLVKTKADLKTIICGGGPEEGKLRAMIEEAQLGDNITLAGEVPHNEVLRLMQRTRVFLHTSNYEGFGTVCLEALYAGAHVVSFTRPMDTEIPHWQHVDTIEEMIQSTKVLLATEDTAFTPVLQYPTDNIAKAMMKLYGI